MAALTQSATRNQTSMLQRSVLPLVGGNLINNDISFDAECHKLFSLLLPETLNSEENKKKHASYGLQ